ncbi:keratin, type II cytoskeletal 8-like [Artibeus jamaicensis]|uniref:keratin, type II cytoskeletal 8-like n=1 Tax=Artibeus jamaicensis TaxID=9417 RepID=UPI00235AA7FE|nr:keratin, type II cytoskeletal 8-like [Artibeus jamaicensis]
MGSMKAVQVNQSLLSPLKLRVGPNIQTVQTRRRSKSGASTSLSFIELHQQLLAAVGNAGPEETEIGSGVWQQAGAGGSTFQVEDLKSKYEDKIDKHTEMENEFVLIRKDVDEVYVNKVELESRLEGLTDDINFYRQLYEEEICELKSQISDVSMVLFMDSSHSLDLDCIITKVNAQYEEIATNSWAEAESMC